MDDLRDDPRETDNRGDDFHQSNEQFLKDRIRALEARVKQLETHLKDTPYYGHSEYCAAVKGPEGEHWLRHEECNCGLSVLFPGGINV